jgi:hypothetical protein
VATSLTTVGASAGLLKMTHAADSVVVTGNIHLGSRNTAGSMTAGSLVGYGNITTDTGFTASGSHNVWMVSNSSVNTLRMNPANSLNGFQNLIFDGSAGKQLASLALQGGFGTNVNGLLLVKPGSGTVTSDGGNNGVIWVHGGSVVDSTALSNFLRPAQLYLTDVNTVPKHLEAGLVDFESGNSVLHDSLNVKALVQVNGTGTLTLNGHTLRTTNGNGFSTTSGGTLVMSNALDTLDVSGWTSFTGGDETGLLTNGVMRLGGNFTQTAVSSATSFVASGSHKSIAVGSGTYSFANPTTSYFNDYTIVAGSTIALSSDMKVNGTLASSGSGAATFSAASTQTLTASGLNVGGPYLLNFINTGLNFIDGVPGNATFNYGSFSGFGPLYAGSMFTVNRAAATSFLNLGFSGTLNTVTGRYVNNAGGGGVTLTSPSPSSTLAAVACICVVYYTGSVTWP